MNKTKKILCTIFVVVASIVLLIPFFNTVIMSMVDYVPRYGLFGSEFVGFKWISIFFSSQELGKLLSNTLIISIISLIIGAAYVFIASFSISNIKNKILKYITAAIFTIPAILPMVLFVKLVPESIRMTPSFLLVIYVALLEGIRFAGLFTLPALFFKDNGTKTALKCMLVFVAIRLLYLFTPDFGLINSIYNVETYEILDTLPTYAFRVSLTRAQYSFGAAQNVISVLLHILPAVIGCTILHSVNKSNKNNTVSLNNTRIPDIVSMLPGIIPIFFLIIMIITGGSALPTLAHPIVKLGWPNELIIALLSAILVASVAYGLTLLARNSGLTGIISLAILCITSSTIIENYLTIRNLGLLDSVFGVAVYNLSLSYLIALIMTVTTYNSGYKRDLPVMIIIFALLFCRFWGDTTSPMIILNRRELFPLSLIIREASMGAQHLNGFLTTLPYLLIPVMLVFGGFIVGSVLKKKD